MSAAHIKAGRRSAMLRAESKERLRANVEASRPSLLPLFDMRGHVTPYRPVGQSRVEWFVRWADEQGSVKHEAAALRAGAETDALIAEYMRRTA